jgi:ketosteroid isomerase-like protein
MSENLYLVRSIFAAWECGDYSSASWAHPDIEFVFADGPAPARWTGVAAMDTAWRDYLSNWENVRVEAEEYRELDSERIFVLHNLHGRGRTSGLEVSQLHAKALNLFHIRDGRVTRLVVYLDGDRALADLGLKG